MRLCGAIKQELENVEIHDLWLVARFLYQYLRDFSFSKYDSQRADFEIRVEALIRRMCADRHSTKICDKEEISGSLSNGTPPSSNNPKL